MVEGACNRRDARASVTSRASVRLRSCPDGASLFRAAFRTDSVDEAAGTSRSPLPRNGPPSG